MPGLRVLRTYQREWLQSDLLAGISLAAVALPIGIAYAELAGFPAVAGIYASILPAVAYALFGSSRQLVVNPDAAACAIVAATVTPLVVGDPTRYVDVAIALTFLTGLLCIAGGLAGLGIIADFLSRPILTGYLNGIALSIIAGQLGTLMGVQVPKAGFFRTIAGGASRLGETHPITFAVGAGLFIFLRTLKHFWPRVPGPLIGAVLGIVLVYAMGLEANGVAVVGQVPAGFPMPALPKLRLDELLPLLESAAGIVLVSFCSMMTTARGFANKNGYSIDANQDMIALGFADLASAVEPGIRGERGGFPDRGGRCLRRQDAAHLGRRGHGDGAGAVVPDRAPGLAAQGCARRDPDLLGDRPLRRSIPPLVSAGEPRRVLAIDRGDAGRHDRRRAAWGVDRRGLDLTPAHRAHLETARRRPG